MPTFNVIVPEGPLSSKQKTRVAVAVGHSYKELIEVSENLTQVIFIEVKRGNSFIGGAPVDSDQQRGGHLRVGRSVETKRSLVEQMVEVVARAAAMPRTMCGFICGHACEPDGRVRSRAARARRRRGLGSGVARGGAKGD